MIDVLSNWLIPLESNLQSEVSRCKLDSLQVSIFQPLKIKPQKIKKRKKKNKITRVPEIYSRPVDVFKERLLFVALYTQQRPFIRSRTVRQRTEVFTIPWGFSATLRGGSLWNFIQFFPVCQAPNAWNYRDLRTLPKLSRQILIRYTKLQPYNFTQRLPLSFRRGFNITLVFQFSRVSLLNPSIITGLQFPAMNYTEEDTEDCEVL